MALPSPRHLSVKDHRILRFRPHGPRELALTLSRLRICAVVGQLLCIVLVARGLGVVLPESALFAGSGVLTVFAALAWWRLRQAYPVGEGEVVAHLAVDIAVLAYLLYLTGGATNPFISLLIMPVALAATALSAVHLAAVVLLAGAAYALLMFRYVPLDAMRHQDAAQQFSLHVLGMGISFAVCASLLGFFVWRLALALRQREAAARRQRERALRDEGILAIAAQAAGAAHELNTPLSTICTLLAELRVAHRTDDPLAQDLALLAAQAERCRSILRELVDVGAASLNAEAKETSIEAFASACADRFRLLRPEVELEVTVDLPGRGLDLRAAPGLQHSLVALLNNAADASALGRSTKVVFSVRQLGDAVEFAVGDRGPGLSRDARDASGLRFFSNKRDGLGLGLALAHATAERLGGDLTVETPTDGGTLMRLRLPLGGIENLRRA
jgi:two-component system, sensor histidine kinase RegB